MYMNFQNPYVRKATRLVNKARANKDRVLGIVGVSFLGLILITGILFSGQSQEPTPETLASVTREEWNEFREEVRQGYRAAAQAAERQAQPAIEKAEDAGSALVAATEDAEEEGWFSSWF